MISALYFSLIITKYWSSPICKVNQQCAVFNVYLGGIFLSLCSHLKYIHIAFICCDHKLTFRMQIILIHSISFNVLSWSKINYSTPKGNKVKALKLKFTENENYVYRRSQDHLFHISEPHFLAVRLPAQSLLQLAKKESLNFINRIVFIYHSGVQFRPCKTTTVIRYNISFTMGVICGQRWRAKTVFRQGNVCACHIKEYNAKPVQYVQWTLHLNKPHEWYGPFPTMQAWTIKTYCNVSY